MEQFIEEFGECVVAVLFGMMLLGVFSYVMELIV